MRTLETSFVTQVSPITTGIKVVRTDFLAGLALACIQHVQYTYMQSGSFS